MTAPPTTTWWFPRELWIVSFRRRTKRTRKKNNQMKFSFDSRADSELVIVSYPLIQLLTRIDGNSTFYLRRTSYESYLTTVSDHTSTTEAGFDVCRRLPRVGVLQRLRPPQRGQRKVVRIARTQSPDGTGFARTATATVVARPNRFFHRDAGQWTNLSGRCSRKYARAPRAAGVGR